MEDDVNAETTGAPSRRDLLKMSGATAVGAATFWAAANAVSAQVADAATGTTGVTHVPTKVVMQFAGRRISRCTQASQRSSFALLTTTDPTGRTSTARVSNGNVQIRVQRLWTGDTTFRDWFSQAEAGLDKPQPLTLSVLGKRGSTISQLTMSDASALEWIGPGFDSAKPSAHATESIVLIAETWKYS